MNIKKYIAWRTVHMVITLLIVLVLLFMLFRLMPGNAASALIVKPGISQIEKDEILIRYGLSKRIDMPGNYFIGEYHAKETGTYQVDVLVTAKGSGATHAAQQTFEVAVEANEDWTPPMISYVNYSQDPGNGTATIRVHATDEMNVGKVDLYLYNLTDSTVWRRGMAADYGNENFTLSWSNSDPLMPDISIGNYVAYLVALDVNYNNATAVFPFTYGAGAQVGARITQAYASSHVTDAEESFTVWADIENMGAQTASVHWSSPTVAEQSLPMLLESGQTYAANLTFDEPGDYDVWIGTSDGEQRAYQRVRVNTLTATRPAAVDGSSSGVTVTGLVTEGIDTEDPTDYPYYISSRSVSGGIVKIRINVTASPFADRTVNVTVTSPSGEVSWPYAYHPTTVVPRPLYEQFFYYMIDMLTFDFGNSFSNNKPVWNEILEKIPATLWLFGNALILAYTIGIAIGMIIAWRRGSALELGTIVVTLFFYSMPIFWIALLAQWIFYTQLHWLPIAGMGGFDSFGNPYTGFTYIKDMLWHLILPLATLTILGLAGDILLMRTSMLEVLGEDFVTTARAKGLKERTIMYKHAARNAMLPVVTSLAMAISGVISGGVLTETIFSWPGMGSMLIRATLTTDFPVVQGAFYILAILTILGNMAADILYAYLDPRVQL